MATTYTVQLQEMVSGSANKALASVDRLKGALDSLESRPRRASGAAIASEWQKMAAQSERAAEREKTAQLRLESQAIASAKRMEDAKRNAAFRRLQAQQRDEERFAQYRIRLDRREAAERARLARRPAMAGWSPGGGLAGLGGMAGMGIAGMAAAAGAYVGGQAMDTVKLLEGARMRLTSALGSAERANQEIKDAFRIAEKTIFDPDEMVSAMSKLATYFKDDETRRYILGAINDFATQSGMGNEGLERAIKAITDIKSKGTMQAEELKNQLGDLGLQGDEVKQEIAKLLNLKGKTDQERNEAVMKLMKKGAITSDIGIQAVTSVMRKQTGGGPAGSFAIKAAGSLSSQLSNLKKGFMTLFAMAEIEKWPAMIRLKELLGEVNKLFASDSKSGQEMMAALKMYSSGLVTILGYVGKAMWAISEPARELLQWPAKMKAYVEQFNFTDAFDLGAWKRMGADLIESLIAGIKDAYIRKFETVVEMGTRVTQGVGEGIKKGLGYVKNAALDLASTVKDVPSAELAIQSPSRVMMRLGQYSAEGFALGLESGAGRVSGASRELGGASTSGLMMGTGGGRGVGGGGGVVINLTLPVQTANDAATLAREAGPLVGAMIEIQMDRYFGRLASQGGA